MNDVQRNWANGAEASTLRRRIPLIGLFGSQSWQALTNLPVKLELELAPLVGAAIGEVS